jgi:hypothetical protein
VAEVVHDLREAVPACHVQRGLHLLLIKLVG